MADYSIYPNAIDSFAQLPLVVDGSTEINAITINRLRDAILKLEAELGVNPSGDSATVKERLDSISGTVVLTTDENLSLGSLVHINSSGNISLADANSGTINDARVIGSSYSSYTAGTEAELYTSPGKIIPVSFSSAPLSSSNGSPVYLSTTPGVATLTAPSESGSVVFVIGILQGADGGSLTPNVIFQPQFVAVN